MQLTTETILDFDRTAGDEDRFLIRHFLADFVTAANSGDIATLTEMISDSTVIAGFSDIPFMKQEFISVVSRWQTKKRMMRFPKLKLSYSRYLFRLTGTYEEFMDNVLVTEGTIEMALIRVDTETKFQFVKMQFYPRMRLNEE